LVNRRRFIAHLIEPQSFSLVTGKKALSLIKYFPDPMNWNKPVKFKLGDVDWEMPLSTLVLVLAVTLVLMVAGGWMGYQFGAGK
jgi:hypothetical protein